MFKIEGGINFEICHQKDDDKIMGIDKTGLKWVKRLIMDFLSLLIYMSKHKKLKKGVFNEKAKGDFLSKRAPL